MSYSEWYHQKRLDPEWVEKRKQASNEWKKKNKAKHRKYMREYMRNRAELRKIDL